MLKKNRRATAVTCTALALVAALIPGGSALADPDGSAGRAAHKVDTSVRVAGTGGASFVAQARAAGLSAGQAGALQAKADTYLAQLGKGATQVAHDKIVFGGADLILAVPGAARAAIACPYLYFCAYSAEAFTGDAYLMTDCSVAHFIPWFSTGSWKNSQTAGTRPLLTFLDDTTWLMPAAYSDQDAGVDWSTVSEIDPC